MKADLIAIQREIDNAVGALGRAQDALDRMNDEPTVIVYATGAAPNPADLRERGGQKPTSHMG